MTTEAMATPATMSPWRNHGLLLLLAMMYADNFVGRQIVAVMIEPIKHEFGASDTSMGLISGLAFAAVFAVLGLPAGRLADRLPRIGVVAASCALWGIATILCGFTGSFLLLVLARMAVAAAEAPAAPAALSLIADLYPPQRRAFAISLFTAAPTFAAIIALSLGAWMVDAWGWRMSFIAAGAPALLIGALVLTLGREPRRGRWDAVSHHPHPLDIRSTLRTLWSEKAVRYLVLASATATLGGTAFGMWNATFLVRSYGLALQHAGLLTGLVGGISAGVGVMFAGWLSDRLGSRGARWRLSVPILGHTIGLLSLAIYLFWPSDIWLEMAGIPVPEAMLWCAVNGFFSVWWLGPSFALLTTLTNPRIRAVAIALQTLLSTLFGVGFGPVLIGTLSDLLYPHLGIEALRHALLLGCATSLGAMILLYRTGRHLPRT
ncbi:putative galactarate transporter [Thauera sp. GDN1]|uniref:spinster family MFS transporter n=1 Tax=Thauera sp. GDN1 TaxID=2944810 RepID=UPI0024798897|nr:MFS transporter [Thauera sp. GDN1]WEN42782.1 putative galactarate transporter [Thauera sp. GDN1]